MSDVATESSSGWQRWQIALAIGLPVGVVTIVTGCIVYYYWRDSEDSSHDLGKEPAKNKAKDDEVPVTVSLKLVYTSVIPYGLNCHGIVIHELSEMLNRSD